VIKVNPATTSDNSKKQARARPLNLLGTVTCPDLAALYAFVTAKVGLLSAVRQVEVVPVLRRLKQAGTRVRDGRLLMT
jgi:hypothetical protein